MTASNDKKGVLSLSVWGRLIRVCSVVNGSISKTFDWKNALADAAVLAGIAFFGSLGGMAVIEVHAAKAVVAASIAAGTQFCITLGIKRGIIRDTEKA